MTPEYCLEQITDLIEAAIQDCGIDYRHNPDHHTFWLDIPDSSAHIRYDLGTVEFIRVVFSNSQQEDYIKIPVPVWGWTQEIENWAVNAIDRKLAELID